MRDTCDEGDATGGIVAMILALSMLFLMALA